MTRATYKSENEIAGLGQDIKAKAQEISSTAAESANEAASRVSEAAHRISESAAGMASTVGKQVDRATATVGSGIKSLGHTLHESGPQGGVAGAATSAVASGLEGSGDYLRDRGLTGLAGDVTAMVRNHPIPTLLAGVAVGFLLARAMRD